jgi:hypothetical protein
MQAASQPVQFLTGFTVSRCSINIAAQHRSFSSCGWPKLHAGHGKAASAWAPAKLKVLSIKVARGRTEQAETIRHWPLVHAADCCQSLLVLRFASFVATTAFISKKGTDVLMCIA